MREPIRIVTGDDLTTLADPGGQTLIADALMADDGLCHRSWISLLAARFLAIPIRREAPLRFDGGLFRYSGCGDRRAALNEPALTGHDGLADVGRQNGLPRERRPWKAAAVLAA